MTQIQIKPVKTNLVLKDMLIKDPAYKACIKHPDMPLKYLCEIDNQEICAKCMRNEDHKGHQVKDLSKLKKIAIKKQNKLEKRKVEWESQYQAYSSLLEKRKNEELDLVTGLFDELEMTIKQRKLELFKKINLCYEHEKIRKENLYGEKCQVRQTLRRKINEYKKDFHTDIWRVLNEEIDSKQFEVDVEIENLNILKFNKMSDTVNSRLKTSLQEQCLQIDTVDFAKDELTFYEIPDKIKSLKTSSHLTFIAENETLKIGLDSKLNKDCVVEIRKWKDIKSIEFCFKELEFDKHDLLTLHYLFSKLKKIQSIKLTQEKERKKTALIEGHSPVIEKNETLFTEFMRFLFRQQDLQTLELSLSSIECNERLSRSLSDSILFMKSLKKFSIDFKSPDILGESIKYLWKILSMCSKTLEAVKIDLSRISVDHLLLNRILNLPNLKSFVLAIDCGKNSINKQNTSTFILSSLKSMKGLEHLGVTLFSCNLKDNLVDAFFDQVASIETLTNLAFVVKEERYDSPARSGLKDSITMCETVNALKKYLVKMDRLSELCFGYSDDVKKMSSRQEIKRFINECERKWCQFKGSGIIKD